MAANLATINVTTSQGFPLDSSGRLAIDCANGCVTGPGSSTSGDVATFNGSGGSTIQDSGVAVSGLAPLASPTFTGTPSLPTGTTGVTQSASDNSTKLATTAYVDQGLAVPWIPIMRNASGSVSFSTTSAKALVWGVVLDKPRSFTKINFKVATLDASSNNYDIGLATSSGAVAGSGNCHYQSTGNGGTFGSTGVKQVSLAGTCTLLPGLYYIAITTNASSSPAALTGTNADAVTINPTGGGDSVGISAGGTLSSFTAPSTSTWTFTATAPLVGFQ